MYSMPPSKCPTCGTPNDAASHWANPDIKPRPGDVMMCFECTEILTIEPDMSTRKITPG